jgi:thiamine-phosphate diphosphorylase
VTRLPPLLVLTDRLAAAARGRTLPETVAAAVAAGARAVVFREKDLSRADRRSLGAEVAAVMPPDGCLIVASDARLATDLGAVGVHLAGDDPRPEPAPTTVGRSCHDRAELQAAAADGVDYVTVSPVYPTPSKPGYGPALGEAALRRLTAIPDVPPVYALGGVDAARAAECLAAGAAGVAVMAAVMTAEDPAAAVAALLVALGATSGVKEIRG